MPEIAWIQLTAWICMQCLANSSGTVIIRNSPEGPCRNCDQDMMKVKVSVRKFEEEEEEEDAKTNK